MVGHNICFKGEIRKIILRLSLIIPKYPISSLPKGSFVPLFLIYLFSLLILDKVRMQNYLLSETASDELTVL